jgi:RNA polymerase-interacting CarD/CdnL/TRCF family regulator
VGAPVRAAASTGKTEEYYEIELVEGGLLQVPVDRAEGVGLRRASNGIEEVEASLRSDAESLPDEARERAAVLRTREQLLEPEALANCVRDLLAQSRGRTLSSGERTWLEKACLRLSEEAALVDRVSLIEARSAIWAVVTELRTGPGAA